MPIKKLSLQAIGALLFLRFASADIFYVKSNQFDAAALSDGQNVSYIYVTVPATTIVQTITTTLYDGKKHKSMYWVFLKTFISGESNISKAFKQTSQQMILMVPPSQNTFQAKPQHTNIHRL